MDLERACANSDSKSFSVSAYSNFYANSIPVLKELTSYSPIILYNAVSMGSLLYLWLVFKKIHVLHEIRT